MIPKYFHTEGVKGAKSVQTHCIRVLPDMCSLQGNTGVMGNVHQTSRSQKG